MSEVSTSFADVSGFLRPGSVAVVGASDDERSLGGAAVRFLDKFNYPGTVWPVHPSATTVNGLTAYPTVSALPGVPDLVILAIAAGRIPDAVRECGEAGVRSVIVWAGGFAEGGPDGIALQEELVAVCQEYGVALLGPNCIGLITTDQPLIASFASFLRDVDEIPAGNISMIGQSGGLVTMAMAHARAAGFGFRYAISTGNEAVLSAADFIAGCVHDEATQVIAVYLEGTRDGDKLVAALEMAQVRGKPVVLLRGGSSAAAARAAAAHTGALASASRVWSAVMQELGVIEVDSLEELLDVVQQVSSAPSTRTLRGPGIAIVTFGGGSGVLAADQCERRGLTTPTLTVTSQDRLAPLVPAIASTQNPIDLTPQVYSDARWLELLPEALDVIAADQGVDAVLLQFGPMAVGALDIARIAKEFMDRAAVPVLLAWPLAPTGVPEYLREQKVNVFQEYDRAVRVLADLLAASRAGSEPTSKGTAAEFDWSAEVPHARAGLVVSEHDSHRLLALAGLPVAEGRLVSTAEAALDAAQALGWPVVMKGMSQTITHKFAAGLVRLGISSADDARDAADALFARGRELGVELEGVYVQHMVTDGTEILVSALRDPVFGVMISVGAGGVLTELIDDVVLHRAPLSPELAEKLLRRSRLVQRTLAKDPAALSPLVAFVARFSQVVANAPWSEFVVEINPVKWSAEQATAVDGLLIIEAI